MFNLGYGIDIELYVCMRYSIQCIAYNMYVRSSTAAGCYNDKKPTHVLVLVASGRASVAFLCM